MKLVALALISTAWLGACSDHGRDASAQTGAEGRMSRGGYPFPSDAELDEIEEYKIATSQLVLAVMRRDGDSLTQERPVYFTFFGKRDDLEAMIADPFFSDYRRSGITESPHTSTVERRWRPYTVQLEITAVPSDDFVERMERPHLEKAIEYDVFYDGFGAALIMDGAAAQTTE